MIKKLTSAALLSLFCMGNTLSYINAMQPETPKDEKSSFTITPWKVEGAVDYDEVLGQFGVEPLTQDMIQRWESLMEKSGKNIGLHPWIKRGIFFSHRRFNEILDAYESYLKEKETNPEATCPIFIYTGRGPSSDAMHLGHLIPFMFTKYLQSQVNSSIIRVTKKNPF